MAMTQNISRLFDRPVVDAEFESAVVRIPGAIIISFYVSIFVWPRSYFISSWLNGNVVLAFFTYFAVAIVLVVWIYNLPGMNPARRWLALLFDFGAMLLLLQSSGEAMFPILPVLLLMALVHGLCHGKEFAVVTMIASVAVIGLIYATNPFWRSNPALAIAVLAILIVVPLYCMYMIRSLRRSNEGYRRASVENTRRLARASHDLRHPLHAMSIFAERLAQTRLSAEQRRLLGMIEVSLGNTSDLLQTYLDSATLELSYLRARMAPVRVQSVFDELAVQSRASAELAKVSLRFVPTACVVLADGTMLKAALQNLLVNAILHGSGGCVLVGCRIDGNVRSIQVRNSPRKGSTPEPGPENHGLGLSIAHELARLMQCRIDIKGRIANGFDIRIAGIPLANPSDTALASEPAAMDPLRGTKVALIEADTDTRSELELILGNWGCDVFAAADVAQVPVGRSEIGIVSIGRRDQFRARDLKFLKMPLILLISGRPLKRSWHDLDQHVIEASKPIRPAQLRAMLMSLREKATIAAAAT